MGLTNAWNAERSGVTRLQEIKNEIDQATTELAKAEREYDLNAAAVLKYGKIPELQKALQEEEERVDSSMKSKKDSLITDTVTEDSIAEIVARWTGIPTSKLLEDDAAKLLRLQDELDARVVGQSEATQVVAEAIQRSRAGMADPTKPIATLAFLGPTGVGKTELCKALAKFMFDTEEAMVRVDMSEYMEAHAVSRLVGAPPGYVGFEEGGQLTEAVRRRPYSVLLFDEMEKAHPDVFNILLQLLDDGRLTDSKGNTVNFRNCIVIFTANIGYDPSYGARPLKRTIQRNVETPVAKVILTGKAKENSVLLIDKPSGNNELSITVVPGDCKVESLDSTELN